MVAKAFLKSPLIFLFFLTLVLVSSVHEKEVQAFSNQALQRGAVGDDVIELQARLQYAGFYKGKIDGAFGWNTHWAVRNFQSKFGLKVDGIAGSTTKQKLTKVSKYDERFVKQQIQQGNEFTHYGGTPLSQQVKKRGGKTTKTAKTNQSVKKIRRVQGRRSSLLKQQPRMFQAVFHKMIFSGSLTQYTENHVVSRILVKWP